MRVQLRPSVLDPAGEATRAAAGRLGIGGLSRLRIGKAIDLELEAEDRQCAERTVAELCDRLLVNPVTETWTCDVQEAP